MSNGERIYHLPNSLNYCSINMDKHGKRRSCTEELRQRTLTYLPDARNSLIDVWEQNTAMRVAEMHAISLGLLDRHQRSQYPRSTQEILKSQG